MNFLHFLQQNWPELLTHLREHLELVLISTGVAVLIGIPTGHPKPGAVWFSYSASVHRRHRRAHRYRGAGALLVAADYSQHCDRHSGG